MAVYFVYRSHYGDPAGKRLARFDDESVLAWFRNHWGDRGQLDALLGFHVYGLDTVFNHGPDEERPPPETDEQLERYLREDLYSEGPVLYQPHLLTVQTEDDELQVCYYVFDDHYLAEHGRLAAYLLNDGWSLPGDHAEAGDWKPAEPTEPYPSLAGKGQGAVYLVFNFYEDSYNLSPTGRIDGVRLPDLARYLCEEDPTRCPGGFLFLIRSQLLSSPVTGEAVEDAFRQAILANPGDDASWAAYSDWLQERDQWPVGMALLEQALSAVARMPVAHLPGEEIWLVRPGPVAEDGAFVARLLADLPPGRAPDPAKGRLQVQEHLAQVCLHTDRWGETDLYQQWIFFDDLWAAAHPDLANALLRYERCWDVLSPDGPHDND
jgi:uncharacterized protein (TIGR02996 family)